MKRNVFPTLSFSSSSVEPSSVNDLGEGLLFPKIASPYLLFSLIQCLLVVLGASSYCRRSVGIHKDHPGKVDNREIGKMVGLSGASRSPTVSMDAVPVFQANGLLVLFLPFYIISNNLDRVKL